METLLKCNDITDGEAHYQDLLRLAAREQEDPTFLFLSRVFRALGNKTRCLLVSLLREKDRCVCELEVFLQKSQPTVSHHLRALEEVGLIKGWKKGKFTHYSLVKATFETFQTTLAEWQARTKNWFSNVPTFESGTP